MIKLTRWPADENEACPSVYVNPNHVVLVQPTGSGSLVGLFGQPIIRVKEDVETVRRRMNNPGEWMP